MKTSFSILPMPLEVKISDRIIAVSDIHLLGSNPISRKDNLEEVQWTKVEFLYESAADYGADVLIAGDLFDAPNNYASLNKFASIAQKHKQRGGTGVNTYVVFGQHDLKYRNASNTNMEILSNAGVVTVAGKDPICGDGFKLYGASWMEEVPKPEGSELAILLVHAPISPKALFHGHHYISISDFIKENPYNIVICGDVHRTFIEEHNGAIVLNSGPLLRKEADEYNLIHRPGFFYIDMSDIEIEFVEVPHRPSSEVISRKHIDKKKAKEVSAARADTARFLEELRVRSGSERVMDIRERLILKIQEPSAVSSSAKDVLAELLNEKGLKPWLEKH
jgi:DNA repair exonuclease SbcCD nuclease subunit